MQESGDNAALGTVRVVGTDGAIVEMTQAEALTYLGGLTAEERACMLPSERAPLCQKALEVLAELSIEVPVCRQSRTMTCNGAVIDAAALTAAITPFGSPFAALWKVSYNSSAVTAK